MSSNPYALEPSSRDGSHSELAPYVAINRPDFSYSPPPDTRDLGEYIDILKRHANLILGCFAASVIGAILYCLSTPPTYTARTTIELRGHQPLLSNSPSETLFGSDTRKIEYQKTTVAKLTLTGLADKVLRTNGMISELEEYWHSPRSKLERGWESLRGLVVEAEAPQIDDSHDNPYFQHSTSQIRKYLSMIDIEPIHETNLVDINASSSDPALSQRIANTHAIQFIEHLKQERRDAIAANVELLHTQANELKQRVTQAENELALYASQNKLLMVRGDESGGINNRHIESLAQTLAEATGRRIRSESAFNEARRKSEDEGSVSDNEVTRDLRVSLKQAETEYASLGTQVTAAFPGMRELQAKISSLKKGINEERRRTISGLESQFESDRNTEQNLRQQIEQEKANAQENSKKLIQYSVLSKEASSLRDLYQTVLKQAKEIEMSASATTSNVFIADYADLPTKPSAPKTNVILIVFSCIGLTAGVFLALIRESLKDAISSSEQAQQTLDLPILGSIPEFSDMDRPSPAPTYSSERLLTTEVRTESGSEELEPLPLPPPTSSSTTNHEIVTISSPHSAIAEALRTIRANLLLSSADYPPRVVAVSSAAQGEGKTTIIANLAVTLAQANHRTLLIDGDLRLAGLTRLFTSTVAPGSKGLSDLLTGQTSIEGATYSSPIPHLYIMPAGSKAPNPAELVGSASMKKLLENLKDSYDFILLDTPPIMAVADALLVSRFVDSILFVVRCGHTPRSVARDARQKLAHVRARVIGVVLNEVPTSTHHRNTMRYGANYIRGN